MRARRALLLAAWLGLVLLPGAALATSLRFFGTGEGGIDRVTIQIDPHKKLFAFGDLLVDTGIAPRLS